MGQSQASLLKSLNVWFLKLFGGRSPPVAYRAILAPLEKTMSTDGATDGHRLKDTGRSIQKMPLKTFKKRSLPMEPPMEDTVRPSDCVATKSTKSANSQQRQYPLKPRATDGATQKKSLVTTLPGSLVTPLLVDRAGAWPTTQTQTPRTHLQKRATNPKDTRASLGASILQTGPPFLGSISVKPFKICNFLRENCTFR